MDRGLLGVQKAHHALGLVVHGTAGGKIRYRSGDVKEPRDTAGRRSVHHDGVVRGSFVGTQPNHGFLDLAGQQHVAKSGCDRRGELDGTDPAHGAAGDSEVIEHVEVFEERGLNIDGQGVDMPAAIGRGDFGLFVGEGRNVEELRNPLAPFDFHQ